MIQGSYHFINQESVIFGVPAADAVLDECQKRGAERVVVVSGRSLNRKTPLTGAIVQRLGSRYAGIFDDCAEHTPQKTVIALANQLRESKADIVVTVGGGTPIDTVKVALLCLVTGVTSESQLDQWRITVASDGTVHVPKVALGACRQIAIPTTLSGAEFSNMGGCTDTSLGVKHAYCAPGSSPVTVILDPAMTTYTPAQLWLSTGIRAVDHAVESLCSINAQPLTDATCLEALRRLSTSLVRNVAEPSDLAARLDSQLGVWLASTGINRVEFGASHGIGHVLGAAMHVPHGITSCVLLPAVMQYNQSVTQDQQKAIGATLQASSGAEGIRDLIASLGLPTRLRDTIATRDRFPELARKAMSNRWVRSNPRRIDREEQVIEILELAW